MKLYDEATMKLCGDLTVHGVPRVGEAVLIGGVMYQVKQVIWEDLSHPSLIVEARITS